MALPDSTLPNNLEFFLKLKPQAQWPPEFASLAQVVANLREFAALSRAMGAETQRPIAVVIVTGTLSACVLTLIVLPVVYSLWSRRAPAPLALDEVE